MGCKRYAYGHHKWFWHLSAGKRKRMDGVFAQIDAERLFANASGDRDASTTKERKGVIK